LGLVIGGLDNAEGDVPRAAGDIQRLEARPAGRREPAYHGVFPDTVEPARHKVVHQVVALGDAVEHVIDEALLLALADAAKTEGGFHSARNRGALLRHPLSLEIGATITEGAAACHAD